MDGVQPFQHNDPLTHYIALIHKEPESGYGVSFPNVLGVTAVADTLDDALRDASVALAFAFENWPGERPVQHTRDAMRNDAGFREWWVDAVVAAVLPAQGMAEA